MFQKNCSSWDFSLEEEINHDSFDAIPRAASRKQNDDSIGLDCI